MRHEARRVDRERPPLSKIAEFIGQAAGHRSMHIIDSHFHWWPRSIFDKLCKRKGYPDARGSTSAAATTTCAAPTAAQHLNSWAEWFDLDKQFEHMDRPRPPGRRGLLDRAVLGLLLRHAGRGRPRLRHHVERGDGGRAEEISRPAVGERGGAAAGHARRHRGARRRGQPARPDGRQPAGQRRRRPAHRRRAARAVLRARARSSACRCSCIRPTRSSRTCSTATTARCT